ncbi:MAG TPA: GMC family oxidoreductase [Bryobacteraceae bacterium]|nr:GMC family oxidoreductase [Bryobacteraceae bacterium]
MSRAPFKPSEEVDFVVVGSGAAGGVVAKELSTAGFSVVVLEQGPYLRERDFTHDEFSISYQSVLTNDYHSQPNTFRSSPTEIATLKPSIGYGRQVGGGSVHFTGNYWRFHESDFHEKSLFGTVPGASLEDWPIRYADLEPYYTKTEQDLGISGLAGSNPFDGPRSKPYPLPPMPVKSSGVIFERAARKLGLHPFPAPVAILSQPYKGRGACTHCGFCEQFGCEMKAKSSTLATVIPMAEKTGNCEIRSGCYVRKIETDSAGRATGVIYFDTQKREVLQRAKAVVVCANGAETPRLLLMSKSNRFPDGLANSSGMVGKNLMVDVWAEAYAQFEHPLNEYKSIQVTRVLHDYYAADAKRGFYGGGGIDARFNYYPISYGLAGPAPGVPKWGAEFKKSLAVNFNRQMTLEGHCSSIAVESNSFSLDPDVKDAWGLPALRTTYSPHPDDTKTRRFIRDRMVEIFEVAGARKIWSEYEADVLPSVHLMGTCRMGSDPKRSVVNANHRAHDVPNLFLVDGSSFVTSGRQQPTATIQALAYRAADKMIDWAKVKA